MAKNARASSAARGASKKSDTKPELALRSAIWRRGHRFRTNRRDLPGCPDIVFAGARIVVFVDGDFWHGKDWPARRTKLLRGHNSQYWIVKIEMNIARDAKRSRELKLSGWKVMRVWGSEIASDLTGVIERIERAMRARNRR